MAEGQFILCRVCNREVRMEQMTFDRVKNQYICNTCYSRANSLKPMARKTEEPSKPSIFGTKKSPKEEIVKYACHNCKYKFERKRDKAVTKCPYCGGSKLEEVSNEAAKILADSDNFNF
jgi:DNA-directed RNA polymerase subunit RPC12/RpoP